MQTGSGPEVVSADAMQVYDGLPLLTNQPLRPTRLVSIWSLAHNGSVGEYQSLAHAAIDDLMATRGSAVVAGGTGLYFRASLADLALPPAPEPAVRARWEREYDFDRDRTYARLTALDPSAAAAVHANDRRRVVRALELAEGAIPRTRVRPPLEHTHAASDRHRRPGGATRRARTADRRAHGCDVRRWRLRRGRRGAGGNRSRGRRRRPWASRRSPPSPPTKRERVIVRTRQYAAYQRKWMRRIPGLVSVDARRPPDEVGSEILEMARARQ